MANCGCKNGACSCSIVDDPLGTTTLTGTGSLADPFIISASNPTYIRPAAKAFNSAPQSGNISGVDAASTYSTVEFDTDGMFNLGANPTRLTIQTEGYYIIGGQVRFSSTLIDDPNYGKIRRNGTIIESIDSETDREITTGIFVSSRCFVFAQVGDYFEYVSNQNHEAATFAFDDQQFWGLRVGSA